jgi:hypothetical protein
VIGVDFMRHDDDISGERCPSAAPTTGAAIASSPAPAPSTVQPTRVRPQRPRETRPLSYRLNSSNVVHDTIDGEVLAIRSDTGTYYSMQGPTATAWCALISGADVDAMAHAVATHHDADLDLVRDALTTLGADLEAESLLVACPADAAATMELPPETRGQTWEAPRFEKYTDMQDLLLFDPIHEVEPSGWPAVTRDET